MDERLEVYLNDPVICASDLGGGSMWMRDRSGEWFCLEPLRRMIAKTISKASFDRTNDQPIKTYWPSDRGQATYPRAVELRQSEQLI